MPSRLLATALALIALAANAADSGPTVDVPARNWTQWQYSKEGYLQMTLRADVVRPVTADRIDIVDMNLTVFSGDAARRVDTSVVSPAATFFVRERRASGSSPVRLIDFRDNLEITGEDWSYEMEGKKISLHRHVHVVFHASLNATTP
jgi:hypothetical protein